MSSNHSEAGASLITLAKVAVIPEYINLFLLIMAICGMYRGIEVGHPIYAVLFLNLIIPFCATLAQICLFFFIENQQYLMIGTFLGAFCLLFHCNTWCITSVVRYIYIAHENWVHSKIPSMKIQSILACITTIALVLFMLLIITVYAVSLSKLISATKGPQRWLNCFKAHSEPQKMCVAEVEGCGVENFRNFKFTTPHPSAVVACVKGSPSAAVCSSE